MDPVYEAYLSDDGKEDGEEDPEEDGLVVQDGDGLGRRANLREPVELAHRDSQKIVFLSGGVCDLGKRMTEARVGGWVSRGGEFQGLRLPEARKGKGTGLGLIPLLCRAIDGDQTRKRGIEMDMRSKRMLRSYDDDT